MTFEDEAIKLKDDVFLLFGKNAFVMRVEGKNDVPFWKNIFDNVLNDTYKYQIFEAAQTPTPNTRGKKNVLEFAPFADKNLVLCIDSDYDYLHQNEKICTNAYIFQTYCYSIENIKCQPHNIKKALQIAVNQEDTNIDFEVILKKYSETIYDLLVLSVALCEKYDEKHDAFFTSKEIAKAVMLAPIFKDIDLEISNLSEKVDVFFQKYKKYLTAEEVETSKIEFEKLGFLPQNAYLFLRGHQFYTSTISLLNHFQRKIKQHKNTKTALDENWTIGNFPFYSTIKKDIESVFFTKNNIQ